MNALLICPAFPPTFWSYKYAIPFIRKKAALPPLGLLTVAAMLPAEWPKRLVDLNVEALTAADLSWADYARISAMAVQRRSAREVIARCRQAGVKVVAGGPLFTIEHEMFSAEVDHFILKEAEITLPPFLEDLQGGYPKRMYHSQEFPALSRTPIALWGLIDLKRYATMSIQFSRGCPFNCDFCNVTNLFGHRPRQKAAGQVISELDELYRRGWRGAVFFVDDNFIGNKRYLRDVLLPALIKWRQGKKGLPFNTEVSINLADDPGLMELMVAAGFNSVFVGIETPEEDSLAECNKSQNRRRDLMACVKRIQRVVMFLREFKTNGIDTPMDLQRFLAFFRSCLRLGIIGRERAHYWKLMAWTLLRRPRLFSLAMTLAIQGYHFRKVSELHLLNPPGKRRGCHA